MLNSAFNEFATFPDRDLYAEALRPAIDVTIDAIYQPINNGVYRMELLRVLLNRIRPLF